MNTIAVIIPSRTTDNLIPTIKSIHEQTFKDIEIIIVYDVLLGRDTAIRNYGATITHSPYLFFCDSDVVLRVDALEKLYNALIRADNKVAFAYCGFKWIKPDGSEIVIMKDFDLEHLKTSNYISTMSLVRSDVFFSIGGWDTTIRRLQDWDLWLRICLAGYTGVLVPEILFTAPLSESGLSSEKNVPYEKAREYVLRKNKIL